MACCQAPHPPNALKRLAARPSAVAPFVAPGLGVSGTNSLPVEAGTRADGEDSKSRSWAAAERGAGITCGTNPSGILEGGGGRRQGSATAAAATVAGVDGADAGARGTGRPRVAGAAVFQSSMARIFKTVMRLYVVYIGNN
jgi:hypothetical protein